MSVSVSRKLLSGPRDPRCPAATASSGYEAKEGIPDSIWPPISGGRFGMANDKMVEGRSKNELEDERQPFPA